MNLSTIIADRNARFAAGNNAGEGFDPDAEIEGVAAEYSAQTDDDVSVYVVGGKAILVGDANGSWGVSIEIGGEAANLAQRLAALPTHEGSAQRRQMGRAMDALARARRVVEAGGTPVNLDRRLPGGKTIGETLAAE